ncbi:MAG: hypothetical protein M1819_002215 [Sarea resinae]|nr:MAG: hypothetical protein M1819_002215 [Sarea resinae]
MDLVRRKGPQRNDSRIVLHFDYDCFYASVFEAENPALKSLPLAVQQKQIVVTCNYEARRRGLHKLQLIKEAKRICPDVTIVLGEDLTRFRNASKSLYNFLRGFIWSKQVERLGFDEIFMDVTDMIDYNIALLNPNDLENSFFHLSSADPSSGFTFDGSCVSGNVCPDLPVDAASASVSTGEKSTYMPEALFTRLILGSHLARYLRHQLEELTGYTSTVGISTSKLLAKLVGSVNKPKGQTTLIPPYVSPYEGGASNVTAFIDDHEIGRIPGIGFKAAAKLRELVLQRPARFDTGLIYGSTKEKIIVKDVRLLPTMSPELLQEVLGGHGSPQDIGARIWTLIHGVDDSEVGKARSVPKQISIEDSYLRLENLDEVKRQLQLLAASLITRMQADLLEGTEGNENSVSRNDTVCQGHQAKSSKSVEFHWIARPRTLRLSTRPRPPINASGERTRSFNRLSRSTLMPNFVFGLTESVDALAGKLLHEALVPLFRRLHPEKSGWNLSLINVAATNITLAAANDPDALGRNIANMLKQQEETLKDWRVADITELPSGTTNDWKTAKKESIAGSRETSHPIDEEGAQKAYDEPIELPTESQADGGDWQIDEDSGSLTANCNLCGASMPYFAIAAHERFHTIEG